MGYAKCIGRVGALAVALGVGVAVASTPAIGYATPESSDSSSDTDSSATTPSRSKDAPSSTKQDDETPTVTVRSSGGAHTSSATTDVTDIANSGDPDPDPDADPDPGQAAEIPADDDEPDVEAPARGSKAKRAAAADAFTPADRTDTTATQTTDTDTDTDTPKALPDNVVGEVVDDDTEPDAETGTAQLFSATTTTLQTTAADDEPPALQSTAPPAADVSNNGLRVAADAVSAALGPLLDGQLPSLASLAMLAWTRREIGIDGLPLSAASPLAAQATALSPTALSPTALSPTALPGLSELGPVGDVITDVTTWISTYITLQPWVEGNILVPSALRPYFWNQTPVASSMNVETDLNTGSSSGAIPFKAYDPDGNRIEYSVPAKGLPGGPKYGTVSVDNVNGTFTYTPDGTGPVDGKYTDTFAFIANDDTSPHTHAWDGLLNASFGVLFTSFAGGHNDTATVTVFNKMPIRTSPGVAEYNDITGTFSVLTYNIADQPFPISGGAFPRSLNTLDIGERVNAFDIVNVQQDVAYHPLLLVNAAFPDQTPPQTPTWLWPIGTPFTDGLNSFSAYEIESLNRQSWAGGSDSVLSAKGFTYTRQHIPGGSTVDVYNVNANGGDLTNGDIAQLSEFIQRNSKGRAVIVTGDFNQLYTDPNQSLSQFATANGLTDAAVELGYNGVEQPDKIFYRNAALLDPDDPDSSPVQLQAVTYTNEAPNFTNNGTPLSDHSPQSVQFSYSVDAVGPQNVDLANWMADLPALGGLSLLELPIPGTHDSGTYGITPQSDWALTGKNNFGILTEFPEILQVLIIKPVAAGWGKTQQQDMTGQLEGGIRYVDLRLSNEPDGKIWIEHGLRGPEASVVIDDIAQYANDHPKEVVIVYMQNFTGFTPEKHQEFIEEIELKMGDRMVPREVGTDVTLEELWAMDKNVIVVYNNGAAGTRDNLWYDNTLYRPWPDVPTTQQLFPANVRNLANRPANAIWGMFGEPTPNTNNIVVGLLLLGPQNNEQFMWPVHAPVQQWIRVDFKDDVNLVTTDWYDKLYPADASFSRDVIGAAYETLGARLSS